MTDTASCRLWCPQSPTVLKIQANPAYRGPWPKYRPTDTMALTTVM
eukprot:CAMPEP_0172737630 /NCGR_PEP_ID=MMETSP1074-20121228/118179_1 /TAXON_ID=2916 /ORGANISM="Ceratium fusus, Strain PA161109" /LENGTH=45 /DNA_ID= /DNA_START= /DNA_END= /DNA_ORIENTATION=